MKNIIYEPQKVLLSAKKSCLDEVYSYMEYKQFDFLRNLDEFKDIKK